MVLEHLPRFEVKLQLEWRYHVAVFVVAFVAVFVALAVFAGAAGADEVGGGADEVGGVAVEAVEA